MYGYSYTYTTTSPYGRPVGLGSTAAQAQMLAEQEAARRRQAQMMQTAAAPVAPGMMKAEMVVPMDAYPGKSVRIALNGREYMVTIPPGASPGQRIYIQVPVSTTPVVAQAQSVSSQHHHHHSAPPPAQTYSAPPPAQTYSAPPPAQTLSAPPPAHQYSAPPPAQGLSSSYNSSSSLVSTGYLTSTASSASISAPPLAARPSPSAPPPAASAPPLAAKPTPSAPPALRPDSTINASTAAEQGRLTFNHAISASGNDPEVRLRVTTDHLISADVRESYEEHNIISVHEGDEVTLIEGDLEAGLGAPYEDYVNVRTYDGRVGKVAKVALMRI